MSSDPTTDSMVSNVSEESFESPQNGIYIFEVLGTSFKVLFNNIGVFAFYTIVTLVPVFLLQASLFMNIGSVLVSNISAFSILSFVLSAIGYVVLVGSVVNGAYMSLTDEKPKITTVLRQPLKRIIPLFCVSVLAWVFVMLGMFVVIIPGIIIAVFLSVCVPVVLHEKLGIWASLGRSFQLVKGSWWRVFGSLFMGFLMMYIPMLLLTFGSLDNFVGTNAGDQAASIVMFTLAINFVFGTFFTVYLTVMVAVIYYKLRIMKEGIDTHQVASVFE